MKKISIIFIAMLFFFCAVAQKNKLDFNMINGLFQKREIPILGKNFNVKFLNTAEIATKGMPPYDADKAEHIKKIVSELDFINSDILLLKSFDITNPFLKGKIVDLGHELANLKKAYPELNLEDYDAIQKYCLDKIQEHIAYKDSMALKQRLERKEVYRKIDSAENAEQELAARQYHIRDSVMRKEQSEKDSLDEVNRKIANLKFRQECIKLFGKINGAIIAEGNVKIGFTSTMCEYAWGSDYSTTTTYIKGAVIETRYYGRIRKTLTLKNDKLIAVSEF